MRLPAVETALRQAAETARRFPFSILSAVVATAAMMPDPPQWRLRLWATGIVGVSGLTAITVTAERARIAAVWHRLAEFVGAAALAVLYAISLHWPDAAAALRFVQLLLLTHLLVSVLPFIQAGPLGGFWQYNRALLTRYILAALYAVVLAVGLSVALAALKELLHVPVTGRTYRYLWAILGFTFHPWFVLAGVPRDYDALERQDDYPRAIKVFTQFVLIPLVTVYLVILLAYLARVTVTRTWPSGWIGYLVSSVSTVGVLALLLVHPIRERADSKWVNAYGRWFFVALLPPLVMLLMAVGKRIGQYGMTEPRYFLLALALWMLALALYYGITGSRNIKLIPLTLALVTLVTACGPWGAYQVSRQSQRARLGNIVGANGMGRVGAVTRATHDVSAADREELGAVIAYLASFQGDGELAATLGIAVDTVRGFTTDSAGHGTSVAAGAVHWLGLQYVPARSIGMSEYFWVHTRQPVAVEVAGFDQLLAINLSARATVRTGADSAVVMVADSLFRAVTITHGERGAVALDLVDTVTQRGALRHLEGADGKTLPGPIVIDVGAPPSGSRLVIETINGHYTSGQLVLTAVSGYLLLRR